jgi:nucleoside-diphosphate-sugar epimerase
MEMMTMRIFVTGGSGFVGAAAIRRLRSDGHDVLALARSDASADRVRRLGAEPVFGDLEQLPETSPGWLRALAGCDAIVHAAAYMEFWGPDRLFVERNLRPTVALHAAAVRAGVPRFVLVSAASVSSGTQRAPVVDERSDNGRANIAYSRVKLATEQALLTAPSGATRLVILRPAYIWGAGMSTLDEMVQAVHAGRFAWIDHGRHTMDFTHVENLAHAITLALDHGTPDGVYYLTDGHPQPIREFFTALLATQGVTPPSRSIPRPAATAVATIMDLAYKTARRPVAPPLTRWLVAFTGRDRSYDITAARHDLGYQPIITHQYGLETLQSRHPDYTTTAG